MKYAATFILVLFLAFPVMAQDKTPIEVTADNALEWDRANRTFTASGNAMITQGGSSITAPTITARYDEGDNIIIRQVTAEPAAVLKQPNETLAAQTVTADFTNGVLDKVTATENVILTTDKETLYGDKAIYNAGERVITVTGNVRIEQGQNLLIGNNATFDLKTNISTMTASEAMGGRVKATFFGEAAE